MVRWSIALALLLVACASEPPRAAEPPALATIADVKRELEPLLAGFGPTAAVEIRDHEYVAKFDTRMFRVHGIDKTGRIGAESREMEGPNSRGFLLRVRRQEGPYRGAAVLPQTFRRPYWTTWGNAIEFPGGGGHLHVSFSYGSRVNAEFRNAVIRLFSAAESQTSR